MLLDIQLHCILPTWHPPGFRTSTNIELQRTNTTGPIPSPLAGLFAAGVKQLTSDWRDDRSRSQHHLVIPRCGNRHRDQLPPAHRKMAGGRRLVEKATRRSSDKRNRRRQKISRVQEREASYETTVAQPETHLFREP